MKVRVGDRGWELTLAVQNEGLGLGQCLGELPYEVEDSRNPRVPGRWTVELVTGVDRRSELSTKGMRLTGLKERPWVVGQGTAARRRPRRGLQMLGLLGRGQA